MTSCCHVPALAAALAQAPVRLTGEEARDELDHPRSMCESLRHGVSENRGSLFGGIPIIRIICYFGGILRATVFWKIPT